MYNTLFYLTVAAMKKRLTSSIIAMMKGFTTVTTQHPSASYHSSNETNITAVASQQLGSSHQPR